MRQFGEWPLIKVVDTGNSALAHDLYPKTLIREAARRLMTRTNPDMKNLTALEIGSPSGSPPNDCHSSSRRIAKCTRIHCAPSTFAIVGSPGVITRSAFSVLYFLGTVSSEVLGGALVHSLIDDLAPCSVHVVDPCLLLKQIRDDKRVSSV